jgi:hypothetical protein
MDGSASSRTAVVAGAKRSSAFKLPTNKYGCGEPALDGGIAVSDRETPETKRLMFTSRMKSSA